MGLGLCLIVGFEFSSFELLISSTVRQFLRSVTFLYVAEFCKFI